jgi:hypothetical protein
MKKPHLNFFVFFASCTLSLDAEPFSAATVAPCAMQCDKLENLKSDVY